MGWDSMEASCGQSLQRPRTVVKSQMNMQEILKYNWLLCGKVV